MRQADHIYVNRLGYAHHGIYVGRGMVIHYSSSKFTKRDACIAREPIAQFGPRKEIRVHTYRQGACLPPREVLDRAASCIGERDYSLLANNCEHFAMWCKTGSLRSDQINTVVNRLRSVTDIAKDIFPCAPVEVVVIVTAVTSIWKDLNECVAVCKKHARLRARLRRGTRKRQQKERDNTQKLRQSLLDATTKLKLALKYDIAQLTATLSHDGARREEFCAARSRKASAIDKLAAHLEEFRQRALRSANEEEFDDYRFLLARFTEMLTLY